MGPRVCGFTSKTILKLINKLILHKAKPKKIFIENMTPLSRFTTEYNYYCYYNIPITAPLIFHRNAEEVRREDNELQGVSQHVITVDGEAVTSVNGKLLAGHTIGRDAREQDVDQVSVCSCTCIGPVQYDYNRDIRPAERAAANAAAAAAVVYNNPPSEQPLLAMKRVSI